jgi:type IV pilus assembly protein PilQ
MTGNWFGLAAMAAVWRGMLSALIIFWATAALGQNSLQGLSAAIQGGQEMVTLDLAQGLSELPSGFVLQSPARIALDLPGMLNQAGRSSFEFRLGRLKSASLVQSGERLRLVLNLQESTGYSLRLNGRSLVVLLLPPAGAVGAVGDVGAAGSVLASAAPLPPAGSRTLEALRDLDFRLGTDGAGRIIVSLANDQVGVDVRQQGQTLVAEFLQSSLPEGLRRRMDVTDFATPVQTVSLSQAGDRVRLVVEAKGAWTHTAYQAERQLVLDVAPLRAEGARGSAAAAFSGKKISLNFQNIDVRALLQVIADFSKFNIISSDAVAGSVTLRLQEVPWDQALDIILQAKSLAMRKTGNVLWVAPREEIGVREKLDLEAAAALQGLEPLRTQSFQLNYAKAAEVAAQITGRGSADATSSASPALASASRLLSPRGSAIWETRTNQLFVTDVATRLEQVQQLIAKLDIPVRQVLIEARIVEASDAFGKSLGVRLGGSDLRSARGGEAGFPLGGDSRLAFGSSYGNAVASSGAGGVVDLSSNFVNLPALGQGGYSAATFAVSIFGVAANRFLNLELSALEADGKGKVVSSPRVVTADQIKALIEQGTELPYQVASASGATSIAFRKANLKLEVTPQITPEGSIILDLDVNKDSVGQSTAAGFAINTKHIKTQVLVENGGTVVIGGIFELTESDTETKVPLLGDLPLVGNFFKSRSRVSNKQELLVFITPKVLAQRTLSR